MNTMGLGKKEYVVMMMMMTSWVAVTDDAEVDAVGVAVVVGTVFFVVEDLNQLAVRGFLFVNKLVDEKTVVDVDRERMSR